MTDNNDLLVKVTKYYTPIRFMQIYPIIMGQDDIPMSTINYAVTNYAKRLSSYVIVNDKYVYIYASYKKNLDIHTKDFFDAFCRQVKFPFYYDDNRFVITTIGQLNYYKWCINNGIIDWVRKNFDSIKLYMKNKITSTSSSEAVLSLPSALSEDSDITTSEKNRFKNKIITTKKIKLGFDCS
jgi:hypothetical protein